MHEFSLMQDILDSVKPVAVANNASKVTGITLDIGIMTQVVDECMTFAFEALTEDDPLYSGATLEIHYLEPLSKCLDCDEEFTHDRFHLRCPSCGSALTALLRGREMNIASIEVETPDDADERDEQDEPDAAGLADKPKKANAQGDAG